MCVPNDLRALHLVDANGAQAGPSEGPIDFPDNYTVRSELRDVPWCQMTEQAPVTLSEIITSLRVRYWFLNLHYEGAWMESWSHRRCMHTHQTLIDAAKCAMPHGAGWYVFAVECGTAPQLSGVEEYAVDKVRFGTAETMDEAM